MSSESNNENKSNSFMAEDNENDIDKMKEALTCIASEMQKFHDSTIDSESDLIPKCKEKQNVFSELLKCKTKIKLKRNRILRLKQHLRTACSIAKIISNAKEKEAGSMKRALDSLQEEHADLLEKYRIQSFSINELNKENHSMHIKYDNIVNFIRLGYEQLQKINKIIEKETTPLEQLRKLIFYCGQYYADYNNEHDERLRLEHKNNFLCNKILVLQNSVKALTQQLKTSHYRNLKLRRENLKAQSVSNDCSITCSKVTFSKSSTTNPSNDDEEFHAAIESQHALSFHNKIDLSPHLILVKKLLETQDALLKDLKNLTKEFVPHDNSVNY